MAQKKIIFIILALLCFTNYFTPPIALIVGFVLSQFFSPPFNQTAKVTKYLLQVSVVGLGFGINLFEAAKAGQSGIIYTICFITLTLIIGISIGKYLAINKKTGLLISVGTAICGGSAIAAISPIISADENEISVSLGIVFILNSVALLIFPTIGHYFNLSQSQFGMWAAIAIHDTSSVVGAAQQYGANALQIATTVKLARALWIIPISLLISYFYKNDKKIKFPYFILLFVLAMAISTYIPIIHSISSIIVLFAKKGLTLTLFLIGAGLSRKTIQKVGLKTLSLGLILWILVLISSLVIIIKTIA